MLINTKLKFGIGAPYGNSNSLLFMSSNSSSVDRIYSPGILSQNPWTGGFRANKTNPNSVIDELGDILIEASVEYRFDIFKWV
ncbi:MAG: hypothetical protein IPK03_10595 [Bacteroidetes bacterium]|nr:hypothetical protein [Bacteroidota bacterium]